MATKNKIQQAAKALMQLNADEFQTVLKMVEAEKNDFSIDNYKDGERFVYRGVEYIRLGEEQGGVLAITTELQGDVQFDKDRYNKIDEASIKVFLDKWAADNLSDKDILPYTMDLTDMRGCKMYGSVTMKAGLLTFDIWRKYFGRIPQYDDWWWLATPDVADTPSFGVAYYVRTVVTDGSLNLSRALNACGVVPACIFKSGAIATKE